jgi:hypothetical protein
MRKTDFTDLIKKVGEGFLSQTQGIGRVVAALVRALGFASVPPLWLLARVARRPGLEPETHYAPYQLSHLQ